MIQNTQQINGRLYRVDLADPKMVEMIDMEEVKMVLGGEQRELSVFFSDIAGFTTISEQLSPPDLFYLMSLYLSRMTDILKHEG